MELGLELLDVQKFRIGQTAERDFFDAQGKLLLVKGKVISERVWQLLCARQVYGINVRLEDAEVKHFPAATYKKALDFIKTLFNHVITTRRLKDAAIVVETLVTELDNNPGQYIDLNRFRSFDNNTYVHSVNVCLLATIIGKEIGYSRKELRELALGALLHDYGKQSIPLKILNKESRLTDDEFTVIKEHPTIGVRLLKPLRVANTILAAIGQHHERWNGTGYPEGLLREGIHPNARVIAVADVYDALTADRPYHSGLPPYHALEIMFAESGAGFAPEIITVFNRCMVIYPENSVVRLNTGEVGQVIALHKNHPTRPIICIRIDQDGNFIDGGRVIDLLEDLTCFVDSIKFIAL